MAPVRSVVGVTSYAFTVPSILTATLCTPSQSPSTGARVPAVAVKTTGVPSAPSGRKPASSCVQAVKPSSRARAADIWMVVRFMMRVV